MKLRGKNAPSFYFSHVLEIIMIDELEVDEAVVNEIRRNE